MNKSISLVLLISAVVLVNGHGYGVYPVSRQIKCTSNNQNGFYYPADGTGIVDSQCRAAYQYVYNKYGGDANAAVYQFQQKNEYSVMIPSYANGPSALKAAVTQSLCSAGSVNRDVQFGDKSGMSIPQVWPATSISASGASSKTITFEFCATAAHAPNFWEFYVTKSGFNVSTTQITWDNLDLIANITDTQYPSSTTNTYCETSSSYKMNITLPARYSNAVLLSRWQRIDPAGECFINCADFIFSGTPTTTSTSTSSSSSTTGTKTTTTTTGSSNNSTTSKTSTTTGSSTTTSTTGQCMCPCSC